MRGLIVYPYKVEQVFMKNPKDNKKYSIIRVFAKNIKQKDVILEFPDFHPYIYVLSDKKIAFPEEYKYNGKTYNLKEAVVDQIKTEKIEMETMQRMTFIKVTVTNTGYVRPISEYLKEKGYDVRENKIPFEQRFLTDVNIKMNEWIIIPSNIIYKKYEENGIKIFRIKHEKLETHKVPNEVRQKLKLQDDPLTYMVFDIEVYNKNTMKPGDAPIVAIGTIVFNGEGKIIDKKKFVINAPDGEHIEREKEKKLIKLFINYINEHNIDVVIGHNIVQFDIPSLYLRAKKLGIKFPLGKNGSEPYARTKMKISSENTRTSMEFSAWYVYGRIIFDTLFIAKRDLLKLQKYDLKSILEELGIRQKEERVIIPGADLWLWYDNRRDIILSRKRIDEKLKELAKNNMPRTILVKYLDDDIKDTKLLFEQLYPLQKVFVSILNNDLQMISYALSSNIIDAQVIKKSTEKNMILPKQLENAKSGYSGGYVHTPDQGIHTGVTINDFKSLYPTSIITYNISVETYRGEITKEEFEQKYGIKLDNDFKIFGVVKYFYENEKLSLVPFYDTEILKRENTYNQDMSHAFKKFIIFDNKKMGFLPELSNEMLEKRFEAKRKMKEAVDETEKKIWDYRQLAYKRFANSIYGYTGYVNSFLYRTHVAESVTAAGRFSFIISKRLSELMGMKVIYGDTDSIFIENTEELLEHVKEEILNEGKLITHKKIFHKLKKIEEVFNIDKLEDVETIPQKIKQIVEDDT